MTREEAAKWAELYQAYADGNVIQCLMLASNKWEDLPNPLFDGSVDDYRIKPEPKKVEFWVNVYAVHGVGDIAHKTRESADNTIAGKRIACLHIVREYEEGEGL
jgi:hypothetical protein